MTQPDAQTRATPPEDQQRLLALAKRHYQANELPAAADICREIVAADPACAEALHMLGLIAFRAAQHESAEDLLRLAISFNPGAPYYYCNLAQVLAASGRYDEAIKHSNRSIELKSDEAEFHYTLGKVFRAAGRVSESIAAYQQALVLRPNYPQAHSNLGLTLLLNGEFEQGWREFEWRFDRPEMRGLRREFPQPRWDGEPLNGRRILLYAEQGFGDTLHFCRYAPLVADRGGKVIVQCQPELVRLMRSLRGVEEVVPLKQPLPAFEVHYPLMSLPMLFKTTLDSIPASTPYLHPDPADDKHWREHIAAMGLPPRTLKVGLVWSGRSTHQINRKRSFSLDQLAPLFELPGLRFFSLQKGPPEKDVEKSVLGAMVSNVSIHLNDFADTAAVIHNLDLVITVDTAVAHLAGALDKPVWVLMSHVPDWRWMLKRNDSPWYPSMEIFRQPHPSDWATPIREVAEHLNNP